MGTNYYLMSRNKELMQTYFAEKSEWGVYERKYEKEKYWNDPDYLFDWTEGEFA